jgi:electron transport complex protein RnfA
MVDAGKLFSILIMTLLVENYVLVRFLGICPFLGVSKKTDTALAMGMAVTFVMAIASAMAYFIQKLLLVPLKLEYLQTIAFILVIASLVQLVEMAIMKLSPPLYSSLGIYLPLITTNCAVLGVTLINIQANYNFLESLVSGIAAALSFTLAIWLFAGVRERLETSNIPYFMKGMPIALVSAGLIAIAFLGFSGLKL